MNAERTTTFLMANLGSEIVRFFGLKKNGLTGMAKASAERALKIVDSLLNRPDVGGGKEEVKILKMIIEDALSDKPVCTVTEKELNSYFNPFALRVLSV